MEQVTLISTDVEKDNTPSILNLSDTVSTFMWGMGLSNYMNKADALYALRQAYKFYDNQNDVQHADELAGVINTVIDWQTAVVEVPDAPEI